MRFQASNQPLEVNLAHILIVSSVILTTIGIMIIEREKAPAKTENEPIVRTIARYPTIPTTTEGKPVRTSLNSLTADGKIPLPSKF